MKITVQTNLLQRIARYLMLHASFTNNIGLLNGKTGIAIFFYHYAKYTEKRIYNDFAGELIDEIYKEINVNTPLSFRDGLCGIAWGIEYIIQNGFVKANPDKVFEDLDKRIMEWDVRQISDFSLDTGLEGIACYIISRIGKKEKDCGIIRPDYIVDLIVALKKNQEKINPKTIESLENILKKEKNIPLWNPVYEIIDKTKYNQKKIIEPKRNLGIEKAGYAGIGLKIMKIY